ncbi:MAG TPA: DUF4375 domain-containing protein [Afifellaceae bacterium]|nr:DUF4375 domain-containing protein [Afifellaceae bacterium]
MFGKRKVAPLPAASFDGEGDGGSPVTDFATESADPGQVIVRRSALDAVRADPGAYDLVGAVVDFVNAMFEHGCYRRDEISQKALGAYHADYYLAQVNNGGHSQFIRNCGRNAPFVWADASAGLEAMGASDQAGLLDRMITWAEANPEKVARQTGFNGGRAAELDELDTAFYAAEKVAPMIRRSTAWIFGWPELRAVDDGDYEQAMNHMAFLNPTRGERLIAKRVGSFEHQINSWLHAAIGMAATAAPETEVRLHIGGGAMMDVEGEQTMVWSLQTNRGRRFAQVSEEGARLFECVEANNPPMPKIGDAEGMIEAMKDGRLERFRPPLVGPCLSHVEADRIAEAIQYGNRFHAAAAFDLMLRKIGNENEVVPVSAVAASRDDDGAVTVKWILATASEPFIALTTERGAKLMRAGETMPTVSLDADDIAEHAEAYAG